MRIAVLAALAAMASTAAAHAQTMTVGDLQSLIDKGKPGEALATAYVQGVVDGLLAMENMHRRGLIHSREFCKLKDAYTAGTPALHPAYRTVEIVQRWRQAGQPMTAIAPDMVLSLLSGPQYGCE